MNRQARNAKDELSEDEYKRIVKLGDEIFDMIPMEEKIANEGKRIAIDVRTREIRYFDASTPSAALACSGPTWTSIVRIERVVEPKISLH